jgi:hypothetical protein
MLSNGILPSQNTLPFSLSYDTHYPPEFTEKMNYFGQCFVSINTNAGWVFESLSGIFRFLV